MEIRFHLSRAWSYTRPDMHRPDIPAVIHKASGRAYLRDIDFWSRLDADAAGTK